MTKEGLYLYTNQAIEYLTYWEIRMVSREIELVSGLFDIIPIK